MKENCMFLYFVWYIAIFPCSAVYMVFHTTPIFLSKTPQITKFMGPTWGPPGSCRPQMGPMLAPWTLLSGTRYGDDVSNVPRYHDAVVGVVKWCCHCVICPCPLGLYTLHFTNPMKQNIVNVMNFPIPSGGQIWSNGRQSCSLVYVTFLWKCNVIFRLYMIYNKTTDCLANLPTSFEQCLFHSCKATLYQMIWPMQQ